MEIPKIEPRLSEARPWGRIPGEAAGIRLETRDMPLAGTVLKGLLLMALTFGIYRFWYKTNLRRYYWANTRLMGDGFEYAGTGRELFIGFLIAIAVMAPIYLATTISTLMLGETTGAIVGAVISFLFIPALVQIAVYRARRYRLSRTRYRGIRFLQSGTGRAYLLHSIKWLLLCAVTLGICLPQMRTALNRYRINNTYFGTVQAHFDGEAKPLMKRWLMVWGAIMGSLVMFAVFAASTEFKVADIWLALELILALLFLAVVPFAWIVYRVAEFRHFTNHTSFGAMRLASDIGSKSVLWVMVKFGIALAVIPITLMMFIWLSIGAFEGILNARAVIAFAPIIAIVIFLSWVVVYFLLTELYLRRRLWRLYVGSIAITNTAALASVLQQAQQQEGGFGEAFDTGFEIAG